MNSKEALTMLSECANGECRMVFTQCLDLEKIIIQDLERLEKLEKVIEILKNKLCLRVSSYQEFFNIWFEQGSRLYKKITKKDCKLLKEVFKIEK